MSFKDRIRNYNAQKETKVNPPEATKVLEEKSEPEVENVRPPAESAAPPEVSSTSTEETAAATPSDGAASSDAAPKARGRGRPAGSKNSPKPPAAARASEGTTPAPQPGKVVAVELRDAPTVDLVSVLFERGYGVFKL